MNKLTKALALFDLIKKAYPIIRTVVTGVKALLAMKDEVKTTIKDAKKAGVITEPQETTTQPQAVKQEVKK